MTIAYIDSRKKQSTIGVNTGNTTAMDTTTADCLVMVVSYLLSAGAPVIVDTGVNSWGSPVVVGDNGDTAIAIYIVVAPTTDANHIFSVTSTGYPSLAVAAYSGVKQTSPTDQFTGGGTTSSVSVIQPGTQSGNDTGGITPSEGNCLVVYGCGDVWTGTLTTSSGTIRQDCGIDDASGNAYGTALIEEIQTTATARNPRMTQGGGSTHMTAVIASFKSAAGGGGGAVGAAVYYSRLMQQ